MPELRLDFPACLAADFPLETPLAIRAVDEVLAAIAASPGFAPLEDLSPGLRGNDWSHYLRCSQARMVHAAAALRARGVTGGRVLDYGAYFGNFSLMFRALGFEVDAVDAYGVYAPSLSPVLERLGQAGIRTLDFADTGRDLARLDAGSYDVVLCMGVIEHVPHTPRVLLEPLDRVLRPGGRLVMDTPNLAQLPNRQKLARGEPIMTPLPIQYPSGIPFEGHHREYTADEMIWMVQALGHEPLTCQLFNYSAYAQPVLQGRDVTNYWRTIASPTLRELVMVVSQKGTAPRAAAEVPWSAVFEETEPYWQARLPASAPESAEGLIATETLVVDLQAAVTTRDQMLASLQASAVAEVAVRDAEIASLNARLGAAQSALDRTPSERLKRLARRLSGGRP